MDDVSRPQGEAIWDSCARSGFLIDWNRLLGHWRLIVVVHYLPNVCSPSKVLLVLTSTENIYTSLQLPVHCLQAVHEVHVLPEHLRKQNM